MAQLNSRGTLTRARWDYFEQTNGWASVYGSVASGGIGAYFANNSSGALALDLYNLTWFSSVSTAWTVALIVPPFILTPITPTELQVHATQPDQRALAGVCGMYSASASTYFTIQRVSSAVTQGIVEPVAGQPFITLPPGWGVAVGGSSASGPIELSLNVWYQEVTDNIPPAR